MNRLRRRSSEFGTARCEWLETSDTAVLAHACSGERSCLFAIHNLSHRKVDVTVKFGRKVEGLFDVLNNCDTPIAKNGNQRIKLRPYGYIWLRAGHGPESVTEVIG